MYKIYKSEGYHATHYYLCDEDMTAIKWFFKSEEEYVSNIFHNGIIKLGSFNECIYRSSDLQEAIDQLEQMRILESV